MAAASATPASRKAPGHHVSRYRYSRWDGSQLLPPFDADDVLDAMSDDVLAEGDIRRALQILEELEMIRGFEFQRKKYFEAVEIHHR